MRTPTAPQYAQQDERPFLSIIAWPDGWTRDDAAKLLADAGVMDEATARLHVGRQPPVIICQCPPPAARRALRVVRHLGGDGFAPTFDDLAALGQTHKIRDLSLGDGELIATLWREESEARIPFADVEIIIRAQLHSTERHRVRQSGNRQLAWRAAGAYAVAGAYGLALAYGAGYLNSAPESEQRITTSDKLDIHTASRQIYQVDGDKFALRILGEMRGYSDKKNMDQLCELLAHLAPNETVDPYFTLWSQPATAHRLQLPNMKRNNEDANFAFYSRWAATMYRHLMVEWPE